MTKLAVLIGTLNAKAVNAPDGWEDRKAGGVFVSDLISDILISEGSQTLLITSLLSDQVLRTADVIDACAVVLVNRMNVPASLAKAAAKQGLPLFQTAIPKFEACVRLGRVLEKI
jgi:hypothetical protein